MIGQHPQMYALPELHLFGAETISQWLELCSNETFDMDHGLMRVVAQLFFGEQTEETIQSARAWTRRRAHFTTGFLLEVVTKRVHPLVLVEKSPSIVYHIEFLQRALRMFPNARFIHLVQDPRHYCDMVLGALKEISDSTPLPPSHWLRKLASFPDASVEQTRGPEAIETSNPQKGWYVLNETIREFLASVPDHQKLLVRGEDLFTNPDDNLRKIAGWMGLRTDPEAIEAMKHPDKSPYACPGPPNARFGSDYFFLHRSNFDSSNGGAQSLGEPIGHKTENHRFLPEVKELAQEFGYQDQ